jgi:hypothetical protein
MSTAKLQFNLSSLLWFVLAAAAFASQLAFSFDPDWGKDWQTPATVLIAWAILANFYLAKDLRELFAVHCLGPASLVTAAAIFLPEERSFLHLLTNGCFFGNQVSFPIFLAVLVFHLYAFLRDSLKERREKKKSELLLLGNREEPDSGFYDRNQW